METKRRGRKPGTRNYSPEFREMVVAQANDPSLSIAEVAQAHGLNANMVSLWRRQASIKNVGSEQASSVFNWQTSSSSRLLPVEIVDAVAEAEKAVAVASSEPPAHPELVGEPSSCEIELQVSGRRLSLRGISEAFAERLAHEWLK
ncbi:transposase [Cupriavidus necator]